jgi:hypothetical protein
MLKTACSTLAALSVGVLLAGPLQAQEVETTTLKYKPVKNWNYFLPDDRAAWNTVGSELPIAQNGASGFAVDNRPFKLGIDTDGNGRTDQDVKGVAGYALLKSKDQDGESFKYAVRIRKGSSDWEFASSGIYTGKIAGETISLIDLNGNGIWNELGKDAMVVGKGDAASFLSSVVNLKGALYTLDVSANGQSLTAAPYAGESGVLNINAAYETKGKLLSAVFSSRNGLMSFDLANAEDGLLVPTGEYLLDTAFVVKKKDWVRVRRGQMRGVTVLSGVPTQLAWGGPLEMRFGQVRNSDEEVTVEPPTFWGNAGEEYYDFFPTGRSPEIIVVDGDGKELWNGKFCES